MNKILVFIIMIAMIILVRCKKYPENIVLIVPPEVVLKELSGAKLKSYTVNGIDSMEAMEKIFPGAQNFPFRYGPSSTSISSSYYRNYSWGMLTPYVGILNLSEDRKYLYYLYDAAPFNINKIDEWKIIKLTKKELRVTAQKNNNIYEIYFAK
ncbi:MAG: hypothetical protein AB1304_00545 [Bacteroidota bacterium]